MKIVKFIKPHVAGFAEGDVRELDDTLVKSLKKGGFVKDGTKKELDTAHEELANRTPVNTYEKNKQLTNASNSECSECGGTVNVHGDCEGCDDENTEVDEKTYHILTQEDIDANETAAEGFTVGDEVEENEDGTLALGDDEKLVGKPEGNV